jgi:hypothetical protein
MARWMLDKSLGELSRWFAARVWRSLTRIANTASVQLSSALTCRMQ